MGEIPLMTAQGTFVINGAERVVVSSCIVPGYCFESTVHVTQGALQFPDHPDRGSWIEVQFDTAICFTFISTAANAAEVSGHDVPARFSVRPDEEVIKLFYNIEILKLSDKSTKEARHEGAYGGIRDGK